MAWRISSRSSARAALHGDQQRQRRLALAQIVADVLAQCVRVAVVVEQVVDQLERRAQRAAVVGAGTPPLGVGARASTAPSRALASNSLAVLKRITRR